MKTSNRLSVLLIEDREDDYLLVKGLLELASFTVFTLHRIDSFDAGIEAAARSGCDACLLYSRIEGRSGLEFLNEANAKGCNAPVILLTNDESSRSCLAAFQAGAADCIDKDRTDAEALERSITHAVERRRAEWEFRHHAGMLAKTVGEQSAQLREANRLLAEEARRREEAELALKASDEKLTSLIESTWDIVFTLTPEGVVESLNSAFERTLGWRAGEWIGRDAFELIRQEDRKDFREFLGKICEGEAVHPIQARLRTCPDSSKAFEFSLAAQVPGNPRRLICRAREVPVAPRPDTQTVEENALLKNVLESLPYPCYVIDAEDFSILLANSAAVSGGLPAGTRCHDFFHRSPVPCKGEKYNCPLLEIKQSKRPIVLEHVHSDQNGVRHIEIRAYPILDENGAVSKIVEYCLDITDRKEMEENLRLAREELEHRVELRTAELASANMALQYEIAERRRVEAALRFDEKRLEALLQLSRMAWTSEMEIAEYVLEQEVRLTRSKIGSIGFLDEDEKVFTLRAWSGEVREHCGILRTSAHFEIENSGIWADAVRRRAPVIVNGYSTEGRTGPGLPPDHMPIERFMSIPVIDGNRITALAMVANKERDYDQSDVRQLTLLMDGMWKLIEHNRSLKALKESENLAGIGSALSVVAHDIKTPLIAIGGFARLVQSHLGKDHRDWEKMEIILSETTRLEKMVKDMLDFSKPLALEVSAEEIGALIDECFEITNTLAQAKGIELRSVVPTRIPPVHLDRSRMKQALINLLTNAIQASPDGETVAVRSRVKDTDLVVEVIDAGCGIPAIVRKNIFSPFFTTKKEGTGLGLSIVRKIVEAHRGKVDILDNVGNGITFRIMLPIR
ncbi:MAG: GAF domain-containing protein [Desulfobacteraceae bacterium]|nr:GAF domain-containing protein [Desulfobacteraceae bacterium]